MKKLMMVCIAGLLVFAFSSTVLAFDEEENDILKKRADWLGKVMAAQVGREQGEAANTVTGEEKEGHIYTYVSLDVPSKIPSQETPLGAAINYLAENYDPYSYELLGSRGTGKKDNLIIYSFNVNIGRKPGGHSEIIEIAVTCLDTLEVREWDGPPLVKDPNPSDIVEYAEYNQGHKPVIESDRGNDFVSQLTKEQAKELAKLQKKYDLKIFEGNSKSNDLIVLSEEGEQVCQVYTFLNENWADQLIQAICDYFGIAPKELQENSEVIQRKIVEMKVQLKGSGENYTFSGQMADQPEGAVPLQKKQ